MLLFSSAYPSPRNLVCVILKVLSAALFRGKTDDVYSSLPLSMEQTEGFKAQSVGDDFQAKVLFDDVCMPYIALSSSN